jgi:hypothetical protein
MTKTILGSRPALLAAAVLAALAAGLLAGRAQAGPQNSSAALEREKAQREADLEAVRKMPDPGYDFAIVTRHDAVIRSRADFSSAVLRQLKRDEMLALVDRNLTNDVWYSVIHLDSATEGWVRKEDVVVRFSEAKRREPAISAERSSTNEDPSIVITNESETDLNLSIANEQYGIPGRSKRMVVLRPGKYKFHAYRPGGKPFFGEYDFEVGYNYRWIFWTEKRATR